MAEFLLDGKVHVSERQAVRRLNNAFSLDIVWYKDWIESKTILSACFCCEDTLTNTLRNEDITIQKKRSDRLELSVSAVVPFHQFEHTIATKRLQDVRRVDSRKTIQSIHKQASIFDHQCIVWMWKVSLSLLKFCSSNDFQIRPLILFPIMILSILHLYP